MWSSALPSCECEYVDTHAIHKIQEGFTCNTVSETKLMNELNLNLEHINMEDLKIINYAYNNAYFQLN